MRMKATPGDDYLDGYVVETDKFVTAKTSGWATQNVQTAASDDLVDKTLLGNDYTGTITRQQMATFLYRALQYVKKNSDIEYTIWDSNTNRRYLFPKLPLLYRYLCQRKEPPGIIPGGSKQPVLL